MSSEDHTILAQLRKKWGVEGGLPLERFLGHEMTLDKEFNENLLNTIGHELNHLITAFMLNVPLEAMTLTSIPEGNTLGKVTLPDYIDYQTLQVIAMAGSVGAHEGKARVYLSPGFRPRAKVIF